MKIDIVSVYQDDNLRRLELVKEITNVDGSQSFSLTVIPYSTGETLALELNIDDPDSILDCILYMPHISVDDRGPTIIDRVAACKARVTPDPIQQKTVTNRMVNIGIDSKYFPDPIQSPRRIMLNKLGLTNSNLRRAIIRKKLGQVANTQQLSSSASSNIPVVKVTRAHVTLVNGKKVVKHD